MVQGLMVMVQREQTRVGQNPDVMDLVEGEII
jgi:hypothetical protein